MSVAATIRIQEADFDVAQEIAALSKGRTDIGAVVSFTGICRGTEGAEPIAALTLEHYPGMAEAEIKRHADEAMARWPLQGLTVIHRYGRITPGENIVLVVTASQHRAGGVRGGRIPDGLSEDQRAVLEARGKRPRHELDRGAAAMTTRPPRAGPNPDGEARESRRQTRPRSGKIAQGRRRRIADAARFRPLCREPLYARPNSCSRTAPPIRWRRPPSWSAKPCICIPTSSSSLPHARVTAAEGKKILGLIEQRIATRKPAAYLVNKIYMRGLPFYVDERTIVPRSFIGELLDSHFGGDDDDATSLIGDPAEVESVLDLCTGSGCLAILAARHFPNAAIDAVDISKDALAVAARNVGDHGLDDRIALHRGDLFAPLGGKRYDLIISNPPYVDAEGMAGLPRECRAEPKLAFDGGADGLDIVRRILDEAKAHLNPQGGLLCEIGRGRDMLEAAYPAIAAALARYRGFRGRSVLDRGIRSLSAGLRSPSWAEISRPLDIPPCARS